MSEEVYKYSSNWVRNKYTLGTSTTKGLKCWDDLKLQRISGFTGEIISQIDTNSSKVEVDVTDQSQTVRMELSELVLFNSAVRYEYTLVPIISLTDRELYDEMFLPSDKNDAILEVDGIQLHVNRSFLSYHSDFFSTLFRCSFKEGQMEVIPIKDVAYEDIGLLLSTIIQNKTVPKLLELADRFMFPSVIHHVEYHLMNNTKIDNEKLISMADRYGMEFLLEKIIKGLDTATKARKL